VASFHISGDHFSTAKAQMMTGLVFSKKHEVGENETIGPNKGKPSNYGSAVLHAPKDIAENHTYAGLEWVVDNVKDNIKVLLECGAEDMYLDIGVFTRINATWHLNLNYLRKYQALMSLFGLVVMKIMSNDKFVGYSVKASPSYNNVFTHRQTSCLGPGSKVEGAIAGTHLHHLTASRPVLTDLKVVRRREHGNVS
jgi:hypothetical protein